MVGRGQPPPSADEPSRERVPARGVLGSVVRGGASWRRADVSNPSKGWARGRPAAKSRFKSTLGEANTGSGGKKPGCLVFFGKSRAEYLWCYRYSPRPGPTGLGWLWGQRVVPADPEVNNSTLWHEVLEKQILNSQNLLQWKG